MSGASAIPVIPDGCADLLLVDDGPPLVAGPDRTTRWVPLGARTTIVGLRLRPGALRSILACPAGPILNATVRLSDVGAGAAPLARILCASDRPADRHVRLEAWVRGALARSRTVDRAVVAACGAIAADPAASIDLVLRRSGWSPRTARRRFGDACGYGPKHFQRIMRVQLAIRACQAAEPARLADAALAAGYADQPHLTREFRDITGFSPRAYLAHARPEVGAWLDSGW